jgi:hypothetical protein
MTEREHTIILADRLLNEPNADPDDDLRMLARQFQRLKEENDRFRAGLGAIGQIIHGSTRVTCRIAEKTLAGGDPRALEFFDPL